MTRYRSDPFYDGPLPADDFAGYDAWKTTDPTPIGSVGAPYPYARPVPIRYVDGPREIGRCAVCGGQPPSKYLGPCAECEATVCDDCRDDAGVCKTCLDTREEET